MTTWVLKIGTSILRGDNNFSTKEIIEEYSFHIANSLKNGDRIVLVSSGAVGLGCNKIKVNSRPKDAISLQAIASIGQGHLISLYESALIKHSYHVAQILLTRSDFNTRKTYLSAASTIKKLLDWKIIPIINENDSIANEELLYGDNDTLSALVSVAIGAEQLILLTDIDKLYSEDPKQNTNAVPITDVHKYDDIEPIEANESLGTQWGTGGIKTKLQAAKIATQGGTTVHIADGRKPSRLKEILHGSRGGTVFYPNPKPIKNIKSWLLHALKPVGEIEIDAGAQAAIQNKGASLLLVGITKFKGDFALNQPISITSTKGEQIGIGLCSLSSESIKILLKTKGELPIERSPVVVHRDVLALKSEN